MSATQQIKALVDAYVQAIHDQEEGAFRALWAKDAPCTMISIASVYEGVDSVWQDFLLGKIAALYESIVLVEDGLSIKQLDADYAIVVFDYHTECIRRETGEPYGIAGVETQVVVRENGAWKLAHVHYSKK